MKKIEQKPRIPELDIFRGLVLIYMAFTNAYYGLSKTQTYLFSHHGELMSGGDLIIVYFFLMLGFNIPLVEKFKSKGFSEIVVYGLKRGILLIALGMILISYQFIAFGFKFLIFFKSFLVILGIGLIIMCIFSFFLQFKWKLVFLACLIATIQMYIFSTEIRYDINFINPYFLLSSLWGYLLGVIYLGKKEKFFQWGYLFSAVSLLLALSHIYFYKSIPSRQVLNAPFFLFSWAIIWFLLTLLWQGKILRNSTGNFFFTLRKVGSHPLSFWITQSVVIALIILISTFYYYWTNDMTQFFWDFPYRLRTIENHTLAIGTSAVAALFITFSHWLYVTKFSRKKI